MPAVAVREKPATTCTKLLWVNPVTTDNFNEAFAAMIQRVKLPNAQVDIVLLNLPGITLDNLEWRVSLKEAREVLGKAIVSAPCEASLKIMTGLCNKFSVVIGVKKWENQMRDLIREYSDEKKLTSFTCIGLHVEEMHVDQKKTEDLIRTAVKQALLDEAEGIILGCTIEFGFYQVLQDEFDIPVIDAAFACYKDMEYQAMNKMQFGWSPTRKGSMEPPSKERIDASGIYAGKPLIGKMTTVTWE